MKLPDLREFARGRECLIRIPGYCNWRSETVVLCHRRGFGTAGMGQKPCDLNGAHGCSSCHDIVDGRAKSIFSKDEVDLMFAAGVARTLEKVWKHLNENLA